MGRPKTIQLRLAASLVVFTLSALSAPAADELTNTAPFLPPRATVILLAGLPGDARHEQLYAEQINGWLTFLFVATNHPAQVFVLTDAPEPVKLSEQLPVKLLNASRDEFLSLGRLLAGQTNPVVVIAWGHGGTQGRTPVFHVRGPRLTAVDFKEFAAQTPRVESRWLLFFRGSGGFARELAVANRQLITGENETMFLDDPIGLPLLLQAARDKPELSFVALAGELGRATAAWYEERMLARTEEPTLWLGGQTPRLLAPPKK